MKMGKNDKKKEQIQNLLADPLLGVLREMGLPVDSGITTGVIDPDKLDGALDIFWGSVLELANDEEDDSGNDD